jgi:hypothetical protein
MGSIGRFDRLGDDALLAALGVGEPDAAAAFVRRFQRRVYGVAYAVTGDAALADNVAQQSFERARRHAGSYDTRRDGVPGRRDPGPGPAGRLTPGGNRAGPGDVVSADDRCAAPARRRARPFPSPAAA